MKSPHESQRQFFKPVKQLTTVFTPRTGCHEFLRLRQMVVIVEVFTWHIVFRNLVCDHLCHIWISRIFDTVNGVSFERITFFDQLLDTFGVRKGVSEICRVLPACPAESGPVSMCFFRSRFVIFFLRVAQLHLWHGPNVTIPTARGDPFLVRPK
jgi:hypothetical protein